MERQDYYEEEGMGEEVEGEEEEYASDEQLEEETEALEPEVEQETEEEYSPHQFEEEEEVEEEEEENPAPVRKQPNRPSGNARIQQITREKFQLLDELNRIRQENEAIRREAESFRNKANSYSSMALNASDSTAALKLEQAIAKKQRALEDGDIQAQLDADVEIASANYEVQKIKEIKAEEAFREKRAKELYEQQQQMQQQAYKQPAEPMFDQQAAAEWRHKNEGWYNQNSPHFDAELRNLTDNYAAQIENELHRAGRADIIGTREFLNEIDAYVQSVVQARQQEGNMSNRRPVNMRQVRSGVSPVRNTAAHQQAARRKETHKLTPEEREVASLFGVKDGEYLKQKMEDLKSHPERWRYGR